MSNAPSSKTPMKPTLKVFIAVILGVLAIMLINNQFLLKKVELEKLENLLQVPETVAGGPQYSLALDNNCGLCKQKSNKRIHLVTTFFPMSLVKRKTRILLPGSQWTENVKIDRKEAKAIYQKRDRELLDVLQMNLNNHFILAIHIIYHNEKVVKHILNQKLRFTHKLIFHWVEANPTYEHALLYVGKYLLDQLVIFANQDIYLGRGWGVLDHQRIKQEKLVYALTRHGKKERYCRMPDNCARTAAYLGSHDAFVFILTEMPSRDALAILRHRSDQFGIENIMIHAFERYLGYQVTNPCFVLFVYHVHCSRVFTKGRVRVNRFNTTGHARFIDQLYF